MESVYTTWNKAKAYIKDELSPMLFQEYIADIVPLFYDGDQIVLRLEEDYKKNLINNLYMALLINALKFATDGKTLNVKLVVESDNFIPPEATGEFSESYVRFTPKLNSKYTFDTFVVGSNNRLAHAASIAVSQSPGKKYNPLFIYGGVGLGKTHLMHAIAHEIQNNNKDCNIAFVTSEKFTNDFIDAIRRENNLRFRKKYRSVDVLLVDDIQFLAGKEGTQEEFFHTFNELYNSEKQIVLTSDKSPKDIPNLEERLKTRFEWGLTCDISPPNFETRVAILRQKAEESNMEVPDDVIQFLATNLGSNIRELEGVLSKLIVLSDMDGGNITIQMIQENMKDIIDITQKRISTEIIIQTVAKHYGVTYGDVLSAKRTMNIANTRQIAMYLTRQLTDLSLPAIGESFGGRNHSTVIHAVNSVKEDKLKDPVLHKELILLEGMIRDNNASLN